jgi:hypothetical protein
MYAYQQAAKKGRSLTKMEKRALRNELGCVGDWVGTRVPADACVVGPPNVGYVNNEQAGYVSV